MKKYINIMVICMFASMACEVEDKLADALAPNVNTAHVGTWELTHKQNNSAVDCSGDWAASDTSGLTIYSYVLNADGTYSYLPDNDLTGPWSSEGNSGTMNFGVELTFEQSGDDWIMWQLNQGFGADGTASQCYRLGFTKQ